MARVTYTKYENSHLATAISFLSSMFGMGGVLMAVMGILDGSFGMIGAGAVIALVFGFGGSALAETINAHRSNAKKK